MIKILVKRVVKAGFGCFGVMVAPEHIPFAVTVENDETLIPAGSYICKRTYYHAGKYETFEITGIPNRTRVLIHKGNLDTHSKGCVIIAEKFDLLNGVPAILESAPAFKQFMEIVKGCDEFKLSIVDCCQ